LEAALQSRADRMSDLFMPMIGMRWKALHSAVDASSQTFNSVNGAVHILGVSSMGHRSWSR
jgi:hypothetical protein